MKAIYLCALMHMTNGAFSSCPSGAFCIAVVFKALFSFFNSKHAGNVRKGSSLSIL